MLMKLSILMLAIPSPLDRLMPGDVAVVPSAAALMLTGRLDHSPTGDEIAGCSPS